MSKSAKLAAFLEAFSRWHHTDTPFGPTVIRWEEYIATPDDPPPRPEMPKCTEKLLDYIAETYKCHCRSHELVEEVRKYYALRLSLAKGQVYEDSAGDQIEIVWAPPDGKSVFTGVHIKTGCSRFYDRNGKAGKPHPDLVSRIS